jgi:hypothetical protein
VEKEKEEFQDLELRHSINDLKVSGSSPKEALISHSLMAEITENHT